MHIIVKLAHIFLITMLSLVSPYKYLKELTECSRRFLRIFVGEGK
jgi:hypothetical protein